MTDTAKTANRATATDAPKINVAASNPEPKKDDSGPRGALELLAVAGDQAARNELGWPVGGVVTPDLTAAAHSAGWKVDGPAPSDVYVDREGKVSDGKPEQGGDGLATGGFSGTQIAAKGAVVTGAMLQALAEAGVVSSK